MLDFLIRSVLIGTFATAALDVWSLLLNRTAGFPMANWSVAGRWVVSTAGGKVYRPDIGTAPSVPGENAIGWIFHYAVGIAFAAALLLIWPTWAKSPTFWPPMIVGWVTILCGWLIMAPAMGGGWAHANRPDPMTPRLLNIAGHTVFGLALWAAGIALKAM